ncbi:hypothetical protein [Sandaracinobacteroides saxicola]|uniref:Uncharacterized protein n=1 Tax=Sandaracinobacteroides saxicola TaxID=2759707 RepID=A0A7G5IL77_9SPHN|nr:hypothetical protein [Sandaracinobacteroides saxicola]QMW24119.1 hypothetical protein H3309_06590 [Sandaracinobacteroides saxicola]
MDLFQSPPPAREAALCPRRTTGTALAVAAQAALGSGRIEAVDLHLLGGLQVAGVLLLKLDGPVAHLATAPDRWTHSIALDQLMMVTHVLRGGIRC